MKGDMTQGSSSKKLVTFAIPMVLENILQQLYNTTLYNFHSSVLKAIGNSRTPLTILSMSCVLNVILCIVFVSGFKLGVVGSATATAISQGVSSVLYLLCSWRRLDCNDYI
jgi:Na+-driven multidrug efflux pump